MAKRTQKATREQATQASQEPVPDTSQEAPPPSAQETMQAELAKMQAQGTVPEDATADDLMGTSPATPAPAPQPEPSQPPQSVLQDLQPPPPQEAETPPVEGESPVLAFLREQGLESTYENDEAALHGLVNASRRLRERDELASYGQQMLPYHDRLAQVIAAEQPAAAPQVQADEEPSFWDNPAEYDPAWEQMVTTETDDGGNPMYVPAGPHVPADVPQKYAAHQAYRQQVRDRLENDFKGAVREAVEPIIDERMQQMTAQQQAEADMRRVLDDNDSAIFVQGTNRQQLTPFGEVVRGAMDKGATLDFAVEHAKMAQQQAAAAQQQQQVPQQAPAELPQATVIQAVPQAASQMLPSRQGASPSTQVQLPPNANVRDIMRTLAPQHNLPLPEGRPGLQFQQ